MEGPILFKRATSAAMFLSSSIAGQRKKIDKPETSTVLLFAIDRNEALLT